MEQRSGALIPINTLQKAIGLLGLSMPLAMLFGTVLVDDCTTIQSTISKYYYTPLREIFMAIMCSSAVLVLIYKGQDLRDRAVSFITALSMLGVAFFPTSLADWQITSCTTIVQTPVPVGGTVWLHTVSAVLLFLTLGYFSLFRFTKTIDGNEQYKLRSVKIHRTCGILIFVFFTLIFINTMILEANFPSTRVYHFTFWLQSLALIAYGVSWLVKGGVFSAVLSK